MRSGRMKRSERAAVVEDVNAAPTTTTKTVEVATAAAASVAGRNYFLMQLKVCIPLVVNKTPRRAKPGQAGPDQAKTGPVEATKEILTILDDAATFDWDLKLLPLLLLQLGLRWGLSE